MVIVSFPPHYSHRLQPLDVGVLGPFKSKLRVVQNDWMVSNPGKTINNHKLAALANIAYTASFTIKNITAAFKKWCLAVWSSGFYWRRLCSILNPLCACSCNTASFISSRELYNRKSTKHEQNKCCCNILYTSETWQWSIESVYRSSYPWRCKAVPKGSNSNKEGWAKKNEVSSIDRNARKNRIVEETLMRFEKKRLKLIPEVL